MLTPSLAQEIATDTSALIGFNVLITDGAGTVIGSGDLDRVGSFHEASVGVLRTKQLAAHGTPEAHDLHGVKPGITLPLIVDGVAVGTVGITGAPARVKRFGLLVRRQTEILMQESASVRSGLLRERILEDLVRDIATFDADLVERDFLVSRAAELGYDLHVPRLTLAIEITVSATRVPNDGAPDAPALRPELIRTIRQVFSDPQDIVAATGSGRGAVFYHLSPRRDRAQALAACRRVVKAMQARYDIAAQMAIGSRADSVDSLHASYQDASEALRLGPRIDPQRSVHSIDDLRMHQVIGAVGRGVRRRLTDVALGQLRTRRDWPSLRETMVVWCESGFNLVAAAGALSVHRNTLVYRLDKIKHLVGPDPLDYRAFLTLHLACIADQLEQIDHATSADVGAASKP